MAQRQSTVITRVAFKKNNAYSGVVASYSQKVRVIWVVCLAVAALAGCNQSTIPTPSSVPSSRPTANATGAIEPTPSLAPIPTPQPSPWAKEVACAFAPSSGLAGSLQTYTLLDETGAAETCELSGIDAIEHSPDSQLIAVPAAGELTFWWLDGVCGDRVIELTNSAGAFNAAITEVKARPLASPSTQSTTMPMPCPDVGVYRMVKVQLGEMDFGLSVELNLGAAVQQHCGSIGGCTYYADLQGESGSWRAALGLIDSDHGYLAAMPGLPAAIQPGEYTIKLVSQLVSDVTVNDEPFPESPDAACSADFTVVAGIAVVVVRGTFLADECSVEVSQS